MSTSSPASALVHVPCTPGTLTPVQAALIHFLKCRIGEWVWEKFPDIADDVLHDVVVAILERRRLGLPGTFAALPGIVTATRSKHLRDRPGRYARRTRARPAENHPFVYDADPADDRTPVALVEVAGAVDALPDPLRVVVIGVYTDGKKHREVAAVLGVSTGVIAGRHRTALRALGRALPASGGEIG